MNNKNNPKLKQKLLEYLCEFHQDKLTWSQAKNLVEELTNLIEEKINLLN